MYFIHEWPSHEESQMELKDLVKDLARRVPSDPSKPVLPPGTTDAEIDGFETRTGISVPPMLKDWLKFTNGPCIGAGGVRGLCTPYPADGIEHYYDIFPEWCRRGWIPIAGDGCGDYYVVATRDEDGPGQPVFFIDCHLDENQPAYVVASDFLHFLEFYLGRELEDGGWPFHRDFVIGRDPQLEYYTTVPRAWETD